jgi:hypothetical protein
MDQTKKIMELEAQLEWHKNLNRRLLQLMADAEEHFGAVHDYINPVIPILKDVQQVFAKAIEEVKEAINGQDQSTGV